MNNKLLFIIVAALFTSSCATFKENRTLCIIAGTVAGAAIGSTIHDDDKENDAAVGGIIGGGIAWHLCNQDGDGDGDGVNDANDRCPGTSKGTAVDGAGCPLDTDGDGVSDAYDNCPSTSRGVMVDANGCALDSDGDGVTDNADQCPNTITGRPVNAKGCEADDDQDGIVNALDQCPMTLAGKAVDHKGCNVMYTLAGLNFDTNSAQLTATAKEKLNAVVATLKSHRSIAFRIEGHTDDRGAENYNQRLSEQRAESVRTYLETAGVAANRMTIAGKGESSPTASNDTVAGRATNRRVDFVVTDS